MNNDYIINRPVNALKKVYPPSYLGAKIKASKSNPKLTVIAEMSIEKRLHSSERWNYKRFKVFKAVDENGDFQYRDYQAPSPSAASAEAYILNKISNKFKKSRSLRVYSYITTEPGSNYNYEYYLPHYERRNKDILDELKKGKDRCALFLDIKNFYNSIDQSSLINRLKIHPVANSAADGYIINFVEQQLLASPKGIPIGTEMSHMLADIYLSDLDAFLEKKFSNSYFRYVDDLTIVCNKHEVNSIEKEIQSFLEKIGLQLNNDKREQFTESEWSKEIQTNPVDGEDFFAYCKQISSWIEGDRKKRDTLKKTLINEGFQIPIDKIFSWGNQSNKGRLSTWATEKEIILHSERIRDKYIRAAGNIGTQLNPESTRWFLQKAKRAINPLFYLLNRSEYRTILSLAKENQCLKPHEELSRAIGNSSYRNIIKYPGVTINTLCEILSGIDSMQPDVSLQEIAIPTSAEIDSLTMLSLYEIVAAPSVVINSPIGKALRCNVTSRSNELTGFEGEIESLRIGLTDSDQNKFLRNRLNSDEDVYLDGLELGNQEISA